MVQHGKTSVVLLTAQRSPFSKLAVHLAEHKVAYVLHFKCRKSTGTGVSWPSILVSEIYCFNISFSHFSTKESSITKSTRPRLLQEDREQDKCRLSKFKIESKRSSAILSFTMVPRWLKRATLGGQQKKEVARKDYYWYQYDKNRWKSS